MRGKVLWVGVLIAAVVTAVSLYQTPKYEASAVVLVGLKEHNDTNEAGIHPLPNYSLHQRQEDVARMMPAAIPTSPVAKETLRRLNLPRGVANELLDNLSVDRDPSFSKDPSETPMLIRLTYTDTDPKRAQVIVNTVAKVASDLIPTIGGGEAGATHITATVWQEAELPTTPASTHPLRNGLIALVAGLVLASAWAVVAKLRASWSS
jgi:capsular polysaccharide biosynthesis protein